MSFETSLRIERWYGAQLRKIADRIDKIVRGLFGDLGPGGLYDELNRYATTIEPWAEAVGKRMVDDVDRTNARAWFDRAEEMSRLLKRDATALAARQLQKEQVDLITSLPRQAADRVQDLAIRNLADGGRAKELAREILRTGEVTESRANTIARTETSKATTTLTEVRAKSIGSEGYIWRTLGDTDVRPSHQKMQGKYVAWDLPPTLDGLVGHAGCLPNCRCYADPVLPKE